MDQQLLYPIKNCVDRNKHLDIINAKSRLGSTLSDDEFIRAFYDVFREHFVAVGGCGFRIFDNTCKGRSHPFAMICREIAESMKSRLEFHRIAVTLFERDHAAASWWPDRWVGFVLVYDDVTIRIFLEGQVVTVDYIWPETKNDAEESSSHSSKYYSFDLCNPESLQNLYATIDRRIDDMFYQWRPSD